jgi:murein DD-endopeptidase MepM/ murein hydrolase activator NlpD
MAWQHPFAKSTITSRFGATANRPTPHRGLDYAPKPNTPIPAASAGKIRLIEWSSVLGWVLVHDAKDLITGKTVFPGYSHLSCAIHGIDCRGPKVEGKHSPFTSTKVGDLKKMGEPIGRVGNTGSASRGAHLHFTIGSTVRAVFAGNVQDPEKFIDAQIAEMAKPKVCKCCERPL